MVRLTVTSRIQDALSLLHDTQGTGEKNNHSGAVSIGDPIPINEVIQLSEVLKDIPGKYGADEGVWRLETLLKGSTIYVPPPKAKPQKSQEYLDLMAQLRADEEARSYERMTNPQPASEAPFSSASTKALTSTDLDEMTFSDINRQLTLIINVLVSIIACSAGIWVTAWHWPTPARLGLSMIGSGTVAVAEVAIYFGYIRRLTEAKQKERSKLEQKEIVDTWVIDGKAKSASGRSLKEGVRLRSRRNQ